MLPSPEPGSGGSHQTSYELKVRQAEGPANDVQGEPAQVELQVARTHWSLIQNARERPFPAAASPMSNDAGNGGAVKESEPPRRATTEDSSPANVHNSDPKVSAPPRASIANTAKILKTSTQCVERFAAAKLKPRAVGSSRHSHILKNLPQKRLSVGPDGAPAHQGRVYAIAAGGGIVAAGGVDKALYVHCIGRCQKTDCRSESCAEPEGDDPHVVKVEHKSSIFAVALCHDCSSGDTYIAAGGEDKRVSVYRADKSFASRSSPLTRVEREFKSKESVLTASLSWRTNPHNKSKASLLLAVGGVDCHVRIFDVMDGVLIYSVELPDFVISVTLHSAKDLLAISAKPARVLVLKMDEVFDHNTEVNEAERTKFADFQSKYMQTEHKIALREKVAVRNKRIWEQVPTCI